MHCCLWHHITKPVGSELKEGSGKLQVEAGGVEVAPRQCLSSQDPAGVCGELSNSVLCCDLYCARTKATSMPLLVENISTGRWWLAGGMVKFTGSSQLIQKHQAVELSRECLHLRFVFSGYPLNPPSGPSMV